MSPINFGSEPSMSEKLPIADHNQIAKYLDFADDTLQLSGQKINQLVAQREQGGEELSSEDKAKLHEITKAAQVVHDDQSDIMANELPDQPTLDRMTASARRLLDIASAFICSFEPDLSLKDHLLSERKKRRDSGHS